MAQDTPGTTARAQSKRQSIKVSAAVPSRYMPAIPHALSQKQLRKSLATSAPVAIEAAELPDSAVKPIVTAQESSSASSTPLPTTNGTEDLAITDHETQVLNGDSPKLEVGGDTSRVQLADISQEPYYIHHLDGHMENRLDGPLDDQPSHVTQPAPLTASLSDQPGKPSDVRHHATIQNDVNILPDTTIPSDASHLVFGGVQESSSSSPGTRPPTAPPMSSAPTFAAPEQVPFQDEHMPVHTLMHGGSFTAEAVGPPPLFLPQHLGSQRPNHLSPLNMRSRPEDFQNPPRYSATSSRPFGYSHNTHFHNPPMSFEVSPSRRSPDGNRVPPSEGEFRRSSFQPTQQKDSTEMTSYILGQFGNREFSDYVVQLSSTRYLFPPATLPAHGIILARSPKLLSLMRMQADHRGPAVGYPKFLVVACSDRFLTHEVAFLKAIMRLYGEPLPDKESVESIPCPPAFARFEAMRFALSYAAAGHFLQADEIITYGLILAVDFFSWDTIPSALAFALEGGLSPTFTTFDEDKGSSSSFDETFKPETPIAAPTYGIYSDRMLTNLVKFIVNNCPQDFHLVTTAPQIADIARLPAVAEPTVSDTISISTQHGLLPVQVSSVAADASSQPTALSSAPVAAASTSSFSAPVFHTRTNTNTRLSSIRFGDMEATTPSPSTSPAAVTTAPLTTLQSPPPPPPDAATMTISSILITAPFALLKYIFEATALIERLGSSKTADLLRAVVVERESRRRRAWTNRGLAGPIGATEERLWRNVGWVERVEALEQSHNMRSFKLVRHVAGLETPGSGESMMSGV